MLKKNANVWAGRSVTLLKVRRGGCSKRTQGKRPVIKNLSTDSDAGIDSISELEFAAEKQAVKRGDFTRGKRAELHISRGRGDYRRENVTPLKEFLNIAEGKKRRAKSC